MAALLRTTTVASQPRPSRTAASTLHLMRRLVGRTVVILLLAGVVAAGATAFGHSPLRSAMPSTVLPFAQQQRPAAAGQSAIAARGQAPAAATQSSGAQGLFSGRNAPNLVNGLRQEMPYVSVFAGLTAAAVLGLRLLQPRRKRTAQPRQAGRTRGLGGPFNGRSVPSLVTALLSVRPAATT